VQQSPSRVSIVVLSNLSWCYSHGAIPNKAATSVIHVKAKHKQTSRAATCPCNKHLIATTYCQKLKWNDHPRQTCMMKLLSHDRAVITKQGWSITVLPNLLWYCPHCALPNNGATSVMHAKVKGLMDFLFGGCCIFIVCCVAVHRECIWDSCLYKDASIHPIFPT
jgi:hypothetical protein